MIGQTIDVKKDATLVTSFFIKSLLEKRDSIYYSSSLSHSSKDATKFLSP